jgi:anti-sigma B factor antagonist
MNFPARRSGHPQGPMVHLTRTMAAGFELRLGAFDSSDSSLDIHVSGSLEITNSAEFRQKAMKLIGGNPNVRRVRFVLDGLSYVSSTGIGAFVEIMTELKNRYIEITLSRVPSQVKKVIDLLGFTPFLGLE